MLSDTERRRLAEIESWFHNNDPRLARRFAAGRRQLGRRLLVVALVLVGVAAATFAGVAAGDPPAGIVAGLTVLAVASGCWLSRRSSRRFTAPRA
jgi:hypothetical protein